MLCANPTAQRVIVDKDLSTIVQNVCESLNFPNTITQRNIEGHKQLVYANCITLIEADMNKVVLKVLVEDGEK